MLQLIAIFDCSGSLSATRVKVTSKQCISNEYSQAKPLFKKTLGMDTPIAV